MIHWVTPLISRLQALFSPSPVVEPVAYMQDPDAMKAVRIRIQSPRKNRRPRLTLNRVALIGWIAGFGAALLLLPMPRNREASRADRILFVKNTPHVIVAKLTALEPRHLP